MASTDRALTNSGPAGVAVSRPHKPRSNTLNAAHSMNDPEASTQPCTTWSRANEIRLSSRRSSSCGNIAAGQSFQTIDIGDEFVGCRAVSRRSAQSG